MVMSNIIINIRQTDDLHLFLTFIPGRFELQIRHLRLNHLFK